MERNISNMPVQKLPMSKKTEEWRRDCVDYFIVNKVFNIGNRLQNKKNFIVIII